MYMQQDYNNQNNTYVPNNTGVQYQTPVMYQQPIQYQNQYYYQQPVQPKKKKHGCLIALLVLILIGLTIYGIIYAINKYKEDYGKVILTNKELIHTSHNIYKLDKKLSTLNGKIKTSSSIKSTDIKIYAGNLVLYENSFKSSKKWKMDIDKLSVGMNIIEINIHYKKGEDKKEIIYLYNESKDNIGQLDDKDNDSDGLLNYQEEMGGTDKNKADTDGDGLSDYYERYYTFTDPLKADTDNNKINDGQEDLDKDGLKNVQEVTYKTAP